MAKKLPLPADTARPGLWVALLAALVYCAWLGGHWLPLGYSDKEFGGFVSRVWDVQREWSEHHHLAWWTPFYMSGSSYGLNHTQGLYLLPSLVFATLMDIHMAVKMTALLAIFAGAAAMYGCAWYFLKNDWAAALASITFLLHPEQLIRAAGTEHLGVIVFMPFMPLTFWLFAKALETGKFRDIFFCSLAAFGLLWSHNKFAFVHAVFLAGYLGYWLSRKPDLNSTGRTLAVLGVVTVGLCAILIVPGLLESGDVKLLSGEHEALRQWQHGFAFKSLLALVDRDGAVTHNATTELTRQLQAQAFHPTTQAEADQLRASLQRIFSMNSDSPEKYAGLVLLSILAITVLWNDNRVNRRLFWFLTGCLLVTVMLSCGPSTVWQANLQTFKAIFGLPGSPSALQTAVILSLAALGAFLVIFWRRKLTTTRKRLWAAAALAVFLFLPAFPILALIPFFKEIRAPYVFYDGPGTFFVALLAGFFITDTKWRDRTPKAVAVIAILLLIDYWPYQRPMKDNGVPAHTLRNLKLTYSAFNQDPDWVKTYSISGRYFHLLGPMYGGKPQVYEAFYNWMSPLGTGLLNQSGLSRELLDLFGARYIVCDKTDPQANTQLFAQLRQIFPVTHEDEDFAVLRNDTAHPYVSATTKACLFNGDVRNTAPLALALTGRNYTLVVNGPKYRPYEKVYDDNTPLYPPVAQSAPVPLDVTELTRVNSHQIQITLTAPSDCIAVIAESYYPFWGATVDGKPLKVLQVNTALMGVPLMAGPHAIVLTYHVPKAYALAGIVSALTFVLALGATIRLSRPARPPALLEDAKSR
jgi:hypothetical protein